MVLASIEAVQSGIHRRNVYAGTPAEARRPRRRHMVEKLQVLVDGGKATPGPPLGPALGPLGVNIVEVLKAINEKTKSFEGMKVPVTLLIDPKTKGFSIEVGTPPTSALIVKELKVEKGGRRRRTDLRSEEHTSELQSP